MRDPHVVSLRYRLKTSDTSTFSNPPPVKWEKPAFSLLLQDGVASVTMKEHCGSQQEARSKVEPSLDAWSLYDAITHNGQLAMAFEFEHAEIVDRDPPPAGAKEYNIVGSVKTRCVPKASFQFARGAYPRPPSRFTKSQDATRMWDRYSAYRDGKERLAAMAYFCLTVVETRGLELIKTGRSPKRQKRKAAGQQLTVNYEVLDKLAYLSSGVGDDQQARKYRGSGRALTGLEKEWLKQAVLALILRVGEYDADPTAELPTIGMTNLPEL